STPSQGFAASRASLLHIALTIVDRPRAPAARGLRVSIAEGPGTRNLLVRTSAADYGGTYGALDSVAVAGFQAGDQGRPPGPGLSRDLPRHGEHHAANENRRPGRPEHLPLLRRGLRAEDLRQGREDHPDRRRPRFAHISGSDLHEERGKRGDRHRRETADQSVVLGAEITKLT